VSTEIATEPEITITTETPLPKALRFLEECGSCWYAWYNNGWYPLPGRQNCRENCRCQPPSGRAPAAPGEAVQWPCAKSLQAQRDLAIAEILRLAALVQRLGVALIVAILAVVALGAGLAANWLL